jgi:hypothetical protein
MLEPCSLCSARGAGEAAARFLSCCAAFHVRIFYFVANKSPRVDFFHYGAAVAGSKVIQTKSHDVVAGEEAGSMCWVCNKCTLETSLHLPPATPMRASAPEPQQSKASAAAAAAARTMSGPPAMNRPAAAAVSARSASPTPSKREGAYATVDDVAQMDAKANKPRTTSQTAAAATHAHNLPAAASLASTAAAANRQLPPQPTAAKAPVEAGGAYDIVDGSLLKDEVTDEYGPAPMPSDAEMHSMYGPGPAELDFVNAEEVLKRTRAVAAQQLAARPLPQQQQQQQQQPQPQTQQQTQSQRTASTAIRPALPVAQQPQGQQYNAVPTGTQVSRSVRYSFCRFRFWFRVCVSVSNWVLKRNIPF